MRKATTKQTSAMGWLGAASLALTLAAFGCSSNQYSRSGEPATVTPTINSVNHSMTNGSSSGTEGLPPMSSNYVNPLTPRVDVDAIANLAAQQGFRGRVLGPSDPGTNGGVAIAMGGFESPADKVFPQSTVNSSINSQPTPVITGGDAGAGVTIANAAVAGGSSVTGVGAATTAATGTTATGTTAALTATPAATTSALTTSVGGTTLGGSAVFSPALMNSTPAPQATGTINRTLPNVVATGTTSRTTTTAARTTTAATTSALRATTVGTATGSVAPIRIQAGSNGSITMTNISAAPAVKGK